MTEHRNDRDPVIARALGELEVPDHGPRFWRELTDRLGADEPAAPVDRRVDTSELPSVAVLRPAPPAPREHRMRFLAVAAGVAVLALATGVVLRGDDTSGSGELAASTTLVGSSAPVPTRAAPPAPGDTAARWIEAMGAGDVEQAAAMLGPRSVRYLEALGTDPVAFVADARRDWGRVPAEDGQRLTEMRVPDAGVVVLVEDTTPGGGPAFGVLPMVEDGYGGWLVEPAAFDPDTGGRVELVAPAPVVGGGWEPVSPGVVVDAASAEPTTDFYFSLDGEPLQPSPSGRWDPPGELTSGPHLLVVVVVSDELFSGLAGTLVVEG